MLKFNRIMWKSVTNDTFKILQPLPNCKFDIWQMEQKAWGNLNQDGLLYIELTISFLIGQKRTVNFQNQHLGHHLAADYTIITSRTLEITGNHVMYDCSAWFLRVIMSSLRALCCLLSVKKQKHNFHFFCSMYNRTMIKLGFCDIQKNQGLGKS